MNVESLYEDLLWLPRTPDRFRDEVNRASSRVELFELAKFGLDDKHLNLLYEKYKALRSAQSQANVQRGTRIGYVSVLPFDFLPPALTATALRYKLEVEVECLQFEHFIELLQHDDEAQSLSGRYDFIILSLDLKWLPTKLEIGNFESSVSFIEDFVKLVSSTLDIIRKKIKCKILVQNLVDYSRPFGNYEPLIPGTLSFLIDRVNYEIKQLISHDALHFDVNQLASTVGKHLWLDPTIWDLAKAPFSLKFLPLYCEMVCRILNARSGGARRAIIVDLDNTLWGGVVGDDGVEGISLGNGDSTGEAFIRFQLLLKELRSRGVVISVSSKNNFEIAVDVFRRHPEMVLKEEDIAVFRANWEDKASNIKYISKKLNLGLDSFVFIDDNPAERLLIRQHLPEVAVLELPDNPAYFDRFLLAAGYFESVRLSQEDLSRAEYYSANARRSDFKAKSGDLTQYLLSLEMYLMLRPFDSLSRARIAQLINKSNQFNLTAKRYDESELMVIEQSSDHFTVQARLKDLFGDNGMICVVICRKLLEYWEIDTWLMSCRVLGRMVEVTVLNHLASSAQSEGVSRLVGLYRPSGRNSLVKEHYLKLGFFLEYRDTDGFEQWVLDLNKFSTKDTPIKTESC